MVTFLPLNSKFNEKPNPFHQHRNLHTFINEETKTIEPSIFSLQDRKKKVQLVQDSIHSATNSLKLWMDDNVIGKDNENAWFWFIVIFLFIFMIMYLLLHINSKIDRVLLVVSSRQFL